MPSRHWADGAAGHRQCGAAIMLGHLHLIVPVRAREADLTSRRWTGSCDRLSGNNHRSMIPAIAIVARLLSSFAAARQPATPRPRGSRSRGVPGASSTELPGSALLRPHPSPLTAL
jgi:hypothetical protein